MSCVITGMAEMKAWSLGIKMVHLRPTDTGTSKNILYVRFRQVICEYNLATHLVFFLLKVLRRTV